MPPGNYLANIDRALVEWGETLVSQLKKQSPHLRPWIIKRWLTQNPGLITINKIARALGIAPVDVICGPLGHTLPYTGDLSLVPVIHYWLRRRRTTITALARLAHVSRQTMYTIFKKDSASLSTVHALAAGLDLDTRDFLEVQLCP